MRLAVLLILACGVWAYTQGYIYSGGSLDHLEPKRHAQEQPIQKRITGYNSKVVKGHTLNLHHQFAVTALVLSKKNYNSGREAQLSPVDLALGWGAMSNPNPLRSIRISQSNRFYYFRYQNSPPIPHRQIELNSANMHLIPANEEVAQALKGVKKGHVVSISGYLVDVKGKDGWYWKSSRTRSDTGGGACELVYVEKVSFR